jgi:hypothetical protein
MSVLLDVILPVFLLLGFGYVAVWKAVISDSHIDGLMVFAQRFAIPCLLFRAISTLDLSAGFDAALLGSFYIGAFTGFALGFLGARYLFGRDWEDAIAIGFCGLFSNSVLLGLPITERAFGADALAGNYAIIALHAPFCYCIGITAMEIVRNRTSALRLLPQKVLSAMFHNALIIGITLGFVVNLTSLPLPGAFTDALDLMIRAALPAAAFGVWGSFVCGTPAGEANSILFIVAISLVIHPATVWGLGRYMALETEAFRSAIMTSAMAPGINAYLFANIYGKAKRVAASAVLIGTVATIPTAWIWLTLLS